MRPIVPPLVPPESSASGPGPDTRLDGYSDTGRPGRDHDPAEAHYRSVVHRIDSPLGGGRGGDQSATAAAGMYLQAEQGAAEPVTYVVGVELGGTETWIRLRSADLRALVTAAQSLLAQVFA